jgi:hypothetical protein
MVKPRVRHRNVYSFLLVLLLASLVIVLFGIVVEKLISMFKPGPPLKLKPFVAVIMLLVALAFALLILPARL